MPRFRVSEIAFGVAALAHAVVLLTLTKPPTPAPFRASVAKAEELTIDVEPTVTDEASQTPEVQTPLAAVAMRARNERSAPIAREPAAGSEMPLAAAEVAPSEVVGAQGEANDGWSFSGRKGAALGLNDRTGALARLGNVEAPRPKYEGATAGAVQSTLQALDDGDREKGIARGGPLREAVLEVARTSDAPAVGNAVFEITVGPSHAPKARLISSSHSDAWAKILPQIDRVAASKALRLPPDGQGLRVVIRVEAELALPNGRREKELGVTVTKKGLEHHEEADGISAPKITLPSTTVTINGKVCSLNLTTNPLGAPISGACDFQMIGAHMSRRVKGEIVKEERIAL